MSEEEILEYLEQQRAYAHKFNNKQIISITNVSLKLIKKQQKEIEKKDKIIKEIAKELVNHVGTCPADYSGNLEKKCEKCNNTYEKCWIEYFENKVDKE